MTAFNPGQSPPPVSTPILAMARMLSGASSPHVGYPERLVDRLRAARGGSPARSRRPAPARRPACRSRPRTRPATASRGRARSPRPPRRRAGRSGCRAVRARTRRRSSAGRSTGASGTRTTRSPRRSRPARAGSRGARSVSASARARSRLTIAAVSVISTISRPGGTGVVVSSASSQPAKSASPIVRPDRLTLSVTGVPRSCSRRTSATARSTTQRSMRLDQVEALGDRQERRGRDQLAGVRAHPDQQLEGRDRRVVGQRRPAPRSAARAARSGPRPARCGSAPATTGARRGGPAPAVSSRSERRGAVAARLLGVVHRDVGLDQQLLGARGRRRRRTAARPIDAVTRAWRVWSATTPSRATARSSFSATAPASASVASGRITPNSSPPSRAITSVSRSSARSVAGQARDQLVADRMAERVVDVLEAVEVEDEQRARGARSARRRPATRSSSSSKRRRLNRPVSASWSARYWSWPSKRLRSVMSTIWRDRVGGPAVVAGDGGDGHERPDDVPVGVRPSGTRP